MPKFEITVVRLMLFVALALVALWRLETESVHACDRSGSVTLFVDESFSELASYSSSSSQAAQSKAAYPVAIADSVDRKSNAERDWRRMLDAYNAPDVPADLYPITYTPRSLPQPASGMRITPAQNSELEGDAGLREMARGFLERWRELLDSAPEALSLVSASQNGDTTILTYRQANYPYPIVGGFGNLVLTITSDGRLKQIDDSFIPVVDLPNRPTLDRTATAERIIGRTFSLQQGADGSRALDVTDLKKIAVKQMVIVPIKRPTAIEVHLAWQVDVTAAPAWTVYVDAITGESLLVVGGDGRAVQINVNSARPKY